MCDAFVVCPFSLVVGRKKRNHRTIKQSIGATLRDRRGFRNAGPTFSHCPRRDFDRDPSDGPPIRRARFVMEERLFSSPSRVSSFVHSFTRSRSYSDLSRPTIPSVLLLMPCHTDNFNKAPLKAPRGTIARARQFQKWHTRRRMGWRDVANHRAILSGDIEGCRVVEQ